MQAMTSERSPGRDPGEGGTIGYEPPIFPAGGASAGKRNLSIAERPILVAKAWQEGFRYAVVGHKRTSDGYKPVLTFYPTRNEAREECPSNCVVYRMTATGHLK